MSAQLRHLVEVVSAEQRITIRVLPHDAHLLGGLLPRASYFLYTFPDKSDPSTAVVDTITTDLVFTARHEVTRYTGQYDRLRQAALSPTESLAFLGQMAARLDDGTGSPA